MAVVMIGVDPHKGSHTAVAIGAAEALLGELRVLASASQTERLVAWAAAWPERTWSVEGAAGEAARRLVYVADVGSVAFLFVTSSAASRRDRGAAV